MESFQKRQKEMRRLERQREKAAKRKEIKARKAAGLPAHPEDETEGLDGAAQSPAEEKPEEPPVTE